MQQLHNNLVTMYGAGLYGGMEDISDDDMQWVLERSSFKKINPYDILDCMQEQLPAIKKNLAAERAGTEPSKGYYNNGQTA